jgi:hypothetical protein
VTDLWKVLRYEEVAARVATSLQVGAGVSVLEGPPGVGKSWLARDLGALWEAGGGSAILAEGDLLKGDAPLYPFGFAMSGLPSGWQVVGPAIAGVARAGETLIGTAGLLTATIEALVKARGGKRRNRGLFLGDSEQTILFEIERLAKRRPVLLIADNLHWWDKSSIELLIRLCDPRMWECFPFLEELRVLGVQTPEPYQSISNPEAHEALLGSGETATFRLPRIPRQDFEEVLVALGAEPPPSLEVADVIYSFSGGHLALASRCAKRIAQGESAVFLEASNTEEFLRRLLTDRVRSMGSIGKEAIAMLQVAAILGLKFRREEVTCAVETAESDTLKMLRHCRSEGVLEEADGVVTFVHDLYRQHFLDFDPEQKAAIHERLTPCLRTLKPADYELRCENALEAEQSREAFALAAQAALQNDRDGRSWKDLPPRVLEVLSVNELSRVIERFLAARDALRGYRFRDCLNQLDGLPRDLPKPLLAESDYLRAMCLMSTRSEADRAEGRSILQAWSDYVDVEPELGIRLLQLLLYGLTHLLDKEPGRALEGRIRQILGDRAAFDLAAKDALYTLDRCSASLYQPDVSIIRKGEAVEYYGPTEGHRVLRRPVEYYRCMVNYGAGLIGNAKYEEAVRKYSDVDRLVKEYAPGTFPRVDFPCMNQLLAEYRCQRVDAEEAVRRQRAIVASSKATSDPFYVKNALAVYLTLTESFAESIAIFDELGKELASSRSKPEPSMTYLIGANQAATRFLTGERARASADWSSLAKVVDQIAYSFRPILIRRHQLLAETMTGTSGEVMSPSEFDVHLVRGGKSEFGPLWDNFGRGFRMPEVEFWREN